jgi:hypothetical protein
MRAEVIVLKNVALASSQKFCKENEDQKEKDNVHRRRLIESKRCIVIDQKTKAFVKNIEETFSLVIFAQGACCMNILCTAVFQLTKVSFLD